MTLRTFVQQTIYKIHTYIETLYRLVRAIYVTYTLILRSLEPYHSTTRTLRTATRHATFFALSRP